MLIHLVVVLMMMDLDHQLGVGDFFVDVPYRLEESMILRMCVHPQQMPLWQQFVLVVAEEEQEGHHHASEGDPHPMDNHLPQPQQQIHHQQQQPARHGRIDVVGDDYMWEATGLVDPSLAPMTTTMRKKKKKKTWRTTASHDCCFGFG